MDEISEDKKKKEKEIDMTFLPDWNNNDKVESPIVEAGNYFIMDSEQLISNPFQELQQEAVTEAQKKNNFSMTEKLTMVKNNVCENHFSMAKSRLDRQKRHRLKQLHDNTNKLRHEVKLLDLDRQRHTVQIKKRIQPDKDYSYDDTHIVNMEKRLGANIASFYLEKKLRYPVRMRGANDLTLTPTIQRARASLRQHELHSQSAEDTRATSERVQTAKSVASTTLTVPSIRPVVHKRRIDARSAPLLLSSERRRAIEESKSQIKTTLPAIAPVKQNSQTTTGKPGKTITTEQQLHNSNNNTNSSNTQVKFNFENPLKILASSEESAKLFTRSYTYYPGVTRAVYNNEATTGFDSSDDDDDYYLPEFVDLRALFFDKDKKENTEDEDNVSIAPSLHSHHQQQSPQRRAQGPPPKLTADMLQSEMDYINSKIQTFIKTLATPKKIDPFSYDSDIPTAPVISVKTPTPRFATKGVDTNKGTNTANNIQSSDPFASKKRPKFPEITTQVSVDKESQQAGEDREENEEKTPRKPKYSWKLIKGRQENAKVDTQRSEDLFLQSLTGVPISNALGNHVPLHSASRAMRHTATFKMYKIVEKLINERTKYERHQVEELKRQMVDGVQEGTSGGPAAERPGTVSRKVSNATVNTLASDRKIVAL